jgi:uncharacterized C2H2 Zn-finger protein
MTNTALITLSSPDETNNYFSQLSQLTEENSDELLFRVVKCILICPECMKLDKHEQVKCNHVKRGAFWLSERKIRRLKRIYGADSSTALRELQGMITDDYDPCFIKSDILRTFTLPHLECAVQPRHIYVSVDPTCGVSIKMAIMSGYMDNNGCFIVSLSLHLLHM